MKYIAPFAPVFTPSAGTLDFSAYAGSFNPALLMAVVDVTADQTLYLPGVPGLGISALSGDGLVFTLQANVSALNAADVLQVFCDDGQGLGTPANNVGLQPGAAGAVGALSSLYALHSGQKFATGQVGGLVRVLAAEDLLAQMLAEIKVHSLIFLHAFNLTDDINDLRSEAAEDQLS
jgi:hypothetical protein